MTPRDRTAFLAMRAAHAESDPSRLDDDAMRIVKDLRRAHEILRQALGGKPRPSDVVALYQALAKSAS